MSSITESIEVKFKRNYDVIVVGGGMAGCAAALAARRRNHSVLLVEKTISLGGLATNGLVVYYNPSLCDRCGRKIIGGIAEELLHASIRYGISTLPSEWTYRAQKVDNHAVYQTQFSVPSFITALDEVMAEAGVDLLFDTVGCGVSIEDGVCTGISMENKEGRVHYGCRQVVDTTGDLDLFNRAGAPCVEGLNWLSFWAMSIHLDKMRECCEKGDIQDVINVLMLGADRNGLNNPDGVRRYTVETGEEVSEFITQGRKYVLEYLKKMDTKNEMVVQLPAQAQYRTTRYIGADYVLSSADKNVVHEDSIGCVYTYREDGFFLEIPYRTMVARGYKNIITAGRSIASVDIACELTRLIIPCAVTGEAAGIAAGIALEHGCDICEVPIDILQNAIAEAGGNVHF